MNFKAVSTTAALSIATVCLSSAFLLSACENGADKTATQTTETQTDIKANTAAPSAATPDASAAATATPPAAGAAAPSLVEGDEVHQQGMKSAKVNAKGESAVSNSATGNAQDSPTTGTISDTTNGTASASPADRRISPMDSARQACQEQNSALVGKDLDACVQKRLKTKRL